MTQDAEPALRYEPISVGDESTVVAEFEADASKQADYQSEAELEAAFIKKLQEQAYEYVRITGATELEANLRAQLSVLNSTEFSDAEWARFFNENIAGKNDGI